MHRRVIRWLPLLVLVAAGGAGAAMAATASHHTAAATVRVAKEGSFGMVLVGPNGHTLYRFTPDSRGHSTCTGSCLSFWPQLLVQAGAKPTAGAGATASLVGTIKAAHGKAQVTYAGFPLYYFAGDKAAGQTKGQAFEGKWYVVNAKGALVKHAAATASGQGSTSTTSSGGSAWG